MYGETRRTRRHLGRHLGGALRRHSEALAGALYAYAYMTCWGAVELWVVVDVANLEQHVVTQRPPVGGDAAEAWAWHVGMVCGTACGVGMAWAWCMLHDVWAWYVGWAWAPHAGVCMLHVAWA